jgi:ABC-type multidrug transport system fused ATPase/permease subunit
MGLSITIDGHNVRDLDPRWLHRAIAIVPQEPVLFSGSIKSNIMYSRLASGLPPATQEEVEWAGKQVRISLSWFWVYRAANMGACCGAGKCS